MSSEWNEYTIDEIGDVVGGGTPSSKIDKYWGEEIPWITPKDLSNYQFKRIDKGERSISRLGLNKSSAKLMPKNSVLITSRAPIGYVAIARQEVSTNQGFKSIVPYKNFDSDFIYYLIKGNINLLESVSSGSTFKEISGGSLKKLKFNFPPLPEQKAIAHILGTLDDKIELNRQTNETLEAMAQALFKSWFVDYDPVLDNALAAGNDIPEALQAKAQKRQLVPDDKKLIHNNPELAGLFPSAFVFNGTLDKWIPEGWEVNRLGDRINVKHGYAFKGEYFANEPTSDILLTPGNFKIGGGFKGDKRKYYLGEVPEDYILKKGDLLVTMTDLSKEGDTLGYPALIPEHYGINYLHNQRLGKVEIKDKSLTGQFLYFVLCDKRYRQEIVGGASGTTVKHTAPKKIMAHEFILPSKEVINSFSQFAVDLNNSLGKNDLESESLAQIRDILLPQLISAKVRLPEGMLERFQEQTKAAT